MFAVGNQRETETCTGFAVAHALRANVAIHRKTLVQYNPYLIWALAREQVPRDYHSQIKDYFQSLDERGP